MLPLQQHGQSMSVSRHGSYLRSFGVLVVAAEALR